MTDLDAHKMVLELLAGRRSGMTSRTEQRDAAAAILDALESTAAELRQERERADEEYGIRLRTQRRMRPLMDELRQRPEWQDPRGPDGRPVEDFADKVRRAIRRSDSDLDQAAGWARIGRTVRERAVAELGKAQETIEKVRTYADERYRYGRRDRVVGSMRIASDLYAILGVPVNQEGSSDG